MNVTNRFQLALESQVGTIFIGLILFLVALGVVYLILRRRQREKDILAYLHSGYYEKAKSLASGLQFIGSPKADFFGQQTAVKLSNGTLGVCLIPPPDLSEEYIREQYRLFYRALQIRPISTLAPHLWKRDEDVWIVVQGRLLHPDGRPLLSLKHYIKENRFRDIDKERILLEIASNLNSLHELHTEKGEQLYHGFLLPSSFYLDFGADKTLKRVVLADAGLAFSIGPDKFYQRLAILRMDKQVPMERYRMQELTEQMAILAPEQRDLRSLDQVGPAADYYAFGTLSVYFFTKKLIFDPKLIAWDKIPEKWHLFLKMCLNTNPATRPKSFHDLINCLNDPEMALTQLESAELKQHYKIDDEDPIEAKYEDLVQMVKKNRSSNPLEGSIVEQFDLGLKAIKGSKWSIAKKHFRDAIKLNPNHAEAHMQCAIACYELQDMKEAEQHYESAKKLDPKVAKKFREHIALHI